MRKIYLASSWKNKFQPKAVKMLRELGHEVYDFRNPAPGIGGFSWKKYTMEWGEEIDMDKMSTYIRHITRNPEAKKAFILDRDALNWCDTCILLLPCGRSAHIEAGVSIGQGKDVFIVLNEEQFEPELMYLLSDHICESLKDLKVCLSHTNEMRCSVTYGWNKNKC